MNLAKPACVLFALGALGQSGSSLADPVNQSGQAVQQGVLSSGHASGSAAHAIAASGQTTSAVAAVPLVSGGAVSIVAGVGRAAAAKGSTRATNQPLVIGDETVTAMPPPNEALKAKPAKPQN